VVGQDHVVRSLRNAIRMNRIAQAYLFCGTRGVGKTTMARILAKCLNCVTGPTEEPCQVCDICQAIASGQDVDVIEIDGASNNGVEQVRELRQNVGLRPSRARFKVYYIDEVHMLSTGAFNALLKTLEEPPPHVKFIFATTEANKIPDTVLSRCQRYDLAGITPQLITKTLGEICEHENVGADPEALHIVARRASGSLRDAESLLDRLLASGSSRLTVEVVQALLGTASDERLLAILDALADHDAGEALRLLEQAADQGVQPSDVLGGLLDFLRDAMVLALGAESILLAATPRQKPRLQQLIDRLPIDMILAALQIVDQHRTRLRGSLHGRLLVEMALVRIARLEDLQSLDSLVERLGVLEAGGPPARRSEPITAKKKGGSAEIAGTIAAFPPKLPLNDAAPKEVVPKLSGAPTPPAADLAPSKDDHVPSQAAAAAEDSAAARDARGESSRRLRTRSTEGESAPLDLETVRRSWPDVLAKLKSKWRLQLVEPSEVIAPNIVIIGPKPGYNNDEDETVGSPETLKLLAQGFRAVMNQAVEVRFRPSAPPEESAPDGRELEPRRADALASDPLVQKLVELFEARPVQMDYDGPDANASG
jgi:DNA polymerase-3 subunit gamma/tau